MFSKLRFFTFLMAGNVVSFELVSVSKFHSSNIASVIENNNKVDSKFFYTNVVSLFLLALFVLIGYHLSVYANRVKS